MKTSRIQMTVLLVLAGLILAGLMRLGFWQLDRAAYKQSVLDDLQSARSADPQPIDHIDQLPEQLRFSPVTLTGEFDPHTLLLDNRIHQGQAGVHVISPLRLGEGGGLVLVNRGWVPLPPDRRLPEIETPLGRQQITGMSDLWPQVGVQMGNYPELGESRPVLVPWLDPVRIEALMGEGVAERVILLDPAAESGFVRDWQPQTLPPSRHRGYALQWFGLAATLAILVVIMLLRQFRRPSSSVE